MGASDARRFRPDKDPAGTLGIAGRLKRSVH